MDNGWSVKHLVRQIVSTRAYQQRSEIRGDAEAIDPVNRLYWRANRKRLCTSRPSATASSPPPENSTPVSSAAPPNSGATNYTRRRSIYGYIDRFNLDPILLRTFDFPRAHADPARPR